MPEVLKASLSSPPVVISTAREKITSVCCTSDMPVNSCTYNEAAKQQNSGTCL